MSLTLQLRSAGVATARMRGIRQAMSSAACTCDQPDAFFKYGPLTRDYHEPGTVEKIGVKKGLERRALAGVVRR